MNIYKLATAATIVGAMSLNAYAGEEKIAPEVQAKAEALLKDKAIIREEDLGALSANLLESRLIPFSCTTPKEHMRDYRLEHCASLDGRYFMTRVFGIEKKREYFMVFLDDKRDGITYDEDKNRGDVVSITFPTKEYSEVRALKLNSDKISESWALRDHLKPHKGQLGPDLNWAFKKIANAMYINAVRDAYADTFTTYNPDTKVFFKGKKNLDGLAKSLTDSQIKRHQMCLEGKGHEKKKKE